MTLENLSDKKIAILGFGKEGRSTFEFFKRKNIPIAAVLDMNSVPGEFESQLSGIKVVTGPEYLDGLGEFDLLMRSPGIPRMHPKLTSFGNQDGIYSQTKLFFDLCPGLTIAITGTKGKTTTTSLIHEIVKRSGKKVFLGGNIGEPPLNFVDDVSSGDVVVLEVSSFQSQDLHKSPHVGVILNVTHDHLDDGTFKAASHASHEEYQKAKAQLIANQTEQDFAILHPGLGEIFRNSGQGKKIIYDPASYSGYETNLFGRHNLENIGAAVEAAKAFGVDEESIRAAVKNFAGVPQRLQLVAEKDGIKYVNDSASTNPDSTVAAISAFDSGVVLIVGGSDKGLDYSELGKKIVESKHVKALVAIGQVAGQILNAAKGYQGKILTGAKDMKEIVSQARSVAQAGDVVLLSPGAASFDMFANSKDRGSQFDAEVRG